MPTDSDKTAAVGGRKGYSQEGRPGGKPPRLIWKIERGMRRNLRRLGQRLSRAGDLYRDGSGGSGLIRVLADGTPRRIGTAAELAPIITDRIPMRVERDGKVVSELPPAAALTTAVRAEAFLGCFQPVDRVSNYFDDFTPTLPGYHDQGAGARILHVGQPAAISRPT